MCGSGAEGSISIAYLEDPLVCSILDMPVGTTFQIQGPHV